MSGGNRPDDQPDDLPEGAEAAPDLGTAKLKVWRLPLPGLLLLEPARFGDHRGFFSEAWHRDSFRRAGIDAEFVQDNHSLSREVGVVRGLHFQVPPSAQGKLVRVPDGAVWDVAVDLRPDSPTRGQWAGAVLSAGNWRQLWIPPGFAHGFCTLEPDSEVLYKVDAAYDAAADRGLAWDDPDLGIPWPVPPGGAVLSDKDRRQPRLRDLGPVFGKGPFG